MSLTITPDLQLALSGSPIGLVADVIYNHHSIFTTPNPEFTLADIQVALTSLIQEKDAKIAELQASVSAVTAEQNAAVMSLAEHQRLAGDAYVMAKNEMQVLGSAIEQLPASPAALLAKQSFIRLVGVAETVAEPVKARAAAARAKRLAELDEERALLLANS